MYFVTICTKNRENYFGEIVDEKIKLSDIGEIAKNELFKTEILRPDIKLDEWKIMPNHIHLIVVIEKNISQSSRSVETQCIASLRKNESINKPNQCIASLRKKPINEYITSSSQSNEKIYKNKFGPQINNLSSIIRGYKMSVKTLCNKNNLDFYWQPRFHDRIIRDEKELTRIRKYIYNNAINWDEDRNNEKYF